ncbi:MAG: putative lipid II flippase FtsW [Candidatus Doudnabacteria bacterium]|nr:putative lipid II flippase FtsW [Candidatus Doudnabacteria bacterium]
MFRTREKIKPFEKKLLVVTLLLVLTGLVVVASASVVLSFQRFERTGYYIERQAIFAGIGILLMFIFSRLDYHRYRRGAVLIFALSALLLVAVLLPQIGFQVGNSRRWINLGSFFLQPSEFAKLGLIILLAAWFDTKKEQLGTMFTTLLPPLFFTGLIAGLVILEPDFGSMAAILLIALAMFYAGGVSFSHLLYLAIAGVGFGWLAIQMAPYRLARISSFLEPAADPLGAGYQVQQALLAIGSGGVWGQGLGESRQKFNFLPEPIGDSIFAVMSEEFGFVRVVIVLCMFLVFALLGLALARRAPDNFARLLAVGITMWVAAQVIVNIGAMLGILPLTGITLPFISYGGSSLIALLIGVGIMLNISRHRV